MPAALQIVGIPLAERVQPGADLIALLREPLTSISWPDGSRGITDGDLIVVTSKIVAKAEGRILPATERERAIDEATVRTIAVKQTPRGATKIVQTQHGLVLAAAGIDASNTADGTIVLLPVDPDSSAAELARRLEVGLGVRVGVIITDTLGRPWRLGLTDVAIGAAGVQVLDDYTDRTDAFGRQLETTVVAIADEVAAAADLVKGKVTNTPVAVVRGLRGSVLPAESVDPGARALVRPLDEDLFTLGTREAILQGRQQAVTDRRTVRNFTADDVPDDLLNAAIAAAVTAPAPHHSAPWQFTVLRPGARRTSLLDAMADRWRRDLRQLDGMDESQIERRVRRGDILRSAPVVILPTVDLAAGAQQYVDEGRSAAERDMFLVAGGAAVQGLLIALAAHGVGAAWISSTLFCADVVRQELHWVDTVLPLGAIAIGYPATDPKPRPARSAEQFRSDVTDR